MYDAKADASGAATYTSGDSSTGGSKVAEAYCKDGRDRSGGASCCAVLVPAVRVGDTRRAEAQAALAAALVVVLAAGR